MPLIKEWAQQALKCTLNAIYHQEHLEKFLSVPAYFQRMVVRVPEYLENHRETSEWETMDKMLFFKIVTSAVSLSENIYSPEETLRRLKIQVADLYEYLGEEPAVNDPNQLKINFDR